MFRGRAALRVFGSDSFANDAGTRPRQWILGRISRARKGHSPSVFPFLCIVREPTMGAHENLAGWPVPVRALRKGLTRAFQQRRARADASRSRSARAKPDCSLPLRARDHDQSAAGREGKDKVATTAYALRSGGTKHLFLARYRGCDRGSGGTLPRGWRFYPRPERKRVRGHLAIAFRFDSATWQSIWRAIG